MLDSGIMERRLYNIAEIWSSQVLERGSSAKTGGLIYLFSEEVFSFAHALINIRNRKTIVIWIKLTYLLIYLLTSI